MAKKQIIDIDAEFDGFEFDEREIIQETRRAKIAVARTGLVSGMKGKTHSNESRAKIRVASSSRNHSEDSKIKISQSKSGKKHNAEASVNHSNVLIKNQRAVKPVVTPFGLFITLGECYSFIKENKIMKDPGRNIPKLIKNDPKNYYLISREEYTKLTGKEI